MNTFVCPHCGTTYAPHWRAGDGSHLCRSCAEARDGRCRLPDHPRHGSPCTYSTEEPGAPCRFCAAPVPLDGSPCPQCWMGFDGMTVADVKAVFAADATFHVVPRRRP